jgi:DNA modification methylase
MRALVRDYSRPGDLVVDPCAGGGTTLAAALLEGRRACGAEVNPHHHREAMNRLAGAHVPRGNTLSLFPEISTLPPTRNDQCSQA